MKLKQKVTKISNHRKFNNELMKIPSGLCDSSELNIFRAIADYYKARSDFLLPSYLLEVMWADVITIFRAFRKI